jgi:hypothetical protein
MNEHLDFVSLLCTLPGYAEAIVCQTEVTGSERRGAGQTLAWCVSILSELGKLYGNGFRISLRKNEMIADWVSMRVDASSE